MRGRLQIIGREKTKEKKKMMKFIRLNIYIQNIVRFLFMSIPFMKPPPLQAYLDNS